MALSRGDGARCLRVPGWRGKKQPGLIWRAEFLRFFTYGAERRGQSALEASGGRRRAAGWGDERRRLTVRLQTCYFQEILIKLIYTVFVGVWVVCPTAMLNLPC